MKLYNNVLSKELLNETVEILTYLTTQPVWSSSVYSWDDTVKSYSLGDVLVLDIPQPLTDKLNDELFKKYFYLQFPKLKEVSYQFSVWNNLASINLHDDIQHIFGSTLYLNKTWEVDWGGLFVWKDKEEPIEGKMNSLCPQQNMLVVNNDRELHAVTSVSPFAPESRFTIQIWGK